MQPSSRFRHIRLLIEEGEHSEALTELLILMRSLKAEGYEIDDLLEQRKMLVLKSEDPGLGKRIQNLLNQLWELCNNPVQGMPDGSEEEIDSLDKGGSILSDISDFLGKIGLKKKENSSLPPKRSPRLPNKQSHPSDMDQVDESPADEKVSAEEPLEEIEEEKLPPPPAPPVIEPLADHTQPVHVEEAEDIVNISLYSPESVKAGDHFLLTAFAHLYEQAAEVEKRIQQADPKASLQGAKTLNLPLKRKSQLVFRLSIENWKIKDSVQNLTWFGIPSSVEFEIAVPSDFEGEQVIGSLLVEGANAALGRIRFNFYVQKDKSSPGGDTRFAPTESQNIEQAFFAYAEQNTSLVAAHKEEMQKRGLEVIDPWKIQGEDWEIKVSDGLLESELFCLFWSQDALDSEEVQVSWQMALGHRLSHPQRLPDILPVVLAEPVAEVPDELAFLNFIHTTTSPDSLQKDLSKNVPASVKSKAETYLLDGKEEAFDILYNWFGGDEELLDEILMLHTRWNTLKKKVRIRLLSESEAKIEENKIIHACLGIVGKIR